MNTRTLCASKPLKAARFVLGVCLSVILALLSSLVAEASETPSASRVLCQDVAGYALASPGSGHDCPSADGADCCTPCPSCAGVPVSNVDGHYHFHAVLHDNYAQRLSDTLPRAIYRPPKLP